MGAAYVEAKPEELRRVRISRKLWWFTRLPKRYATARRIAQLVRKMPVIWRLVDRGFIRDTRIFVVPDHQAARIDILEPIKAPEGAVLPFEIVEYFIRTAKHHFIAGFCWCRYAGECKHYPVELGCIFLGEAVLTLDAKFGRVVSMEHALEHARRCREAGLVHCVGHIYGDSVVFGARPHDRLLTICNCCPCCCAIGWLRNLPASLAKSYSKMPGVEVKVNENCSGCGACARDTCIFDAIHVINGKAVIGEVCGGCGKCALKCPEQAIELTIRDSLYVRKAVDQIVAVTRVD